MTRDASYWIDTLELERHPEGGFYRETYRARGKVPLDRGERSFSTAIYYLLTPETYSAMHRLPGDEIFHFYLGDPVEMLELHPDGSASITILGSDPLDASLQHVVKGGTWQGSRLVEGGSWALLGCTVAPGFDYADYESGTAALMDQYPDLREQIARRLPD